jgi:cytochrome c oxidase cbb3-type subunit 3
MNTLHVRDKLAVVTLCLTLSIAISCEREDREFRVEPNAANTQHTLRLSELQPGTTRPYNADVGAPTQSPSTAPTIATTQGSLTTQPAPTQPADAGSILPGTPSTTQAPSPSSQPVGYAIGVLPGSPPATSPTTGPARSETRTRGGTPPATAPTTATAGSVVHENAPPSDSVAPIPMFDRNSQQIQEAMGKLPTPPEDYGKNAYGMSEGKRLYNYFNCVGCHANGGGGMGPALIDDEWIYGSAPDQIFATIVQGRPNGMPTFGGRIPDYQVWQLAHYVRSMSGLQSRDPAPGRSDHMKNKQPENAIEPRKPKINTNATQ